MKNPRLEVFERQIKKNVSFERFKKELGFDRDKSFKIRLDGEEQEMNMEELYNFLKQECRGGKYTTILEEVLRKMGFKNDLMDTRNRIMKILHEAAGQQEKKNNN